MCGSPISTMPTARSRFSRRVPRPRRRRGAPRSGGLTLPMPGRHNALNATAAIAVARELGVSGRTDPHGARELRRGASGASPSTGEWNGVAVIDDYGHHPVEIAAVLKAARKSTRRPGDRGDPAAPLHPARIAVRRVLHLLQRRRHRDRRAGLSGGRAADRRRRPRRARRRACARAGIAMSLPLDGPDRARRPGARRSRSRATTWSASAPARSRNGPTRCRRELAGAAA